MNLSVLLLAARPKTLTAAIVPVFVGTALAQVEAKVNPRVFACSLLSALMIQVGTNFANDAIDFKKGADAGERLGPRRATQSGFLTYRQVMRIAVAALVLALLAGIPLVIVGGWPILAIGLVSLFFAYGYTGGPFPLAYLGLGDAFVFIFFGLVAVTGVYFLHTGNWNFRALVAGAQVGLLATVLIAINNLRDRTGDEKVGKKTLAVRLGVAGSRLEIALLIGVPFLLNFFWIGRGVGIAAGLPFLALPTALDLGFRIFRTAPGSEYNFLLARAAKLHLLFGMLWCVGTLVR